MPNRIKYIRAPGLPKTPIGEEPGDALPTVTSEDNGKVLGVVNGAWAVKTDNDSDGIAVLTYVSEGVGVGHLEYDGNAVTGREINMLFDSGILPVMLNGSYLYLPMQTKNTDFDSYSFRFLFSNGTDYVVVTISADSTAVTFTNNVILPPYDSTDDAGKVLTVQDDDSLAWEEPTGGGSETSDTLLGSTPFKLTSDVAKLKLIGSGEISYSLESDTVADFDIQNGIVSQATLTQEDGFYVLTASASAANWYSTYIDISLTGLAVGTTYNFMADMQGIPMNETAHQSQGHYILYDGSGNTLVTRSAMDGRGLYAYAFTAPTTNVRIRWYPATNSTFAAGTSKAYCKAFYINRQNTTVHTPIVSTSGTFINNTTIFGVGNGVTVSSTPSCAVYSAAVDGGSASLPLEGKTVVCFGDSLFGMYRDSTSAPAYIEEVTGATVYNVGFGGCRMSNHPSHGYAEFSMWALAKAIADDDWTSQDTYASQGSDYFPDQLAILKGIDFDEVDIAVIHYGTNDFGGGVAIGQNALATTHDTLCGAMRYSIEALLSAYPRLKIYISLPVFRFWTSGSTTTYSDSYTNSQNNTLVEVVEAMRSIAREYNLPVIDGYYNLGINKINASEFLGDGTHHNAAGRKLFGTYIGSQILSQLR